MGTSVEAVPCCCPPAPWTSWRQELECPYPGCDRAFKYQGALDKHIIKHNQEDYNDEGVKKEHEGETINHIKLEPEVNVREGSRVPDDNDFLERLLDEMDN